MHMDPGYGQHDSADYLGAVFHYLHRDLMEPFLYDVELYMLGDPNKQLFHSAK